MLLSDLSLSVPFASFSVTLYLHNFGSFLAHLCFLHSLSGACLWNMNTQSVPFIMLNFVHMSFLVFPSTVHTYTILMIRSGAGFPASSYTKTHK